MNYSSLVREARACADEVQLRGWRLAELCWQAMNEHGKSSAQFAADVKGRLTERTVRHYAQAWEHIAGSDPANASLIDVVASFRGASGVDDLEEVAQQIGKSPNRTRDLIYDSQQAARELPPAQVAQTLRTVLARPDVREHLATKPDLAEAVHEASVDVYEREDRQAGHDRSQTVTPQRTPIDRVTAEIEVLVALRKVLQIAQRHGIEEFLISKLQETLAHAQMLVAAGTPERAVADLERWLAEQEA